MSENSFLRALFGYRTNAKPEKARVYPRQPHVSGRCLMCSQTTCVAHGEENAQRFGRCIHPPISREVSRCEKCGCPENEVAATEEQRACVHYFVFSVGPAAVREACAVCGVDILEDWRKR